MLPFIYLLRFISEGSTIIPLCVVPYYKEPPVVKPYYAALLKNEFHQYCKTQWDLTTQRVIDYFKLKIKLKYRVLCLFMLFK